MILADRAPRAHCRKPHNGACRICARLMILKTLFFVKTLCTYAMRILHKEKSLQDHVRFPYPTFTLSGDMPDAGSRAAAPPNRGDRANLGS
jgi:hypothetical protein